MAFDDGQRIEGGVRQPVAAGYACDEGFGFGTDYFELAQCPASQPRGSGVLAFERLGFGWARRGGARSLGATSPV